MFWKLIPSQNQIVTFSKENLKHLYIYSWGYKYLILSLFLLSKKTKLIPIVANKVRRFTKIFMIYCRCWCSGVCNLAMSWLLTDWWGRCHIVTLIHLSPHETEKMRILRPGPRHDGEGGRGRKCHKKVDIDDCDRRTDKADKHSRNSLIHFWKRDWSNYVTRTWNVSSKIISKHRTLAPVFGVSI